LTDDRATEEERKREDRRRLIGDGPYERGGGYNPGKGLSAKEDLALNAGCCLFEAAASSALLVGVGLSVYTLLP
jgi:hypothetical protein